EENDGKTEEKDFVFYFPPVFSPKFISSRLLKRAFLRDDYIQVDETTLPVVDRPGSARKAYVWAVRSASGLHGTCPP
ncbi:MAG: IS66 family transposase, partial [Tannerellaceae bacterium]|nr:IS66 family transposase [Tannerellaceae bacterium]